MTAPFPEIRVAAAADVAEVESLLESAALTRDGLAACARGGQLLVARADDGCLMGCVALELFGNDALLRSLAVSAGARGHGRAARCSPAQSTTPGPRVGARRGC